MRKVVLLMTAVVMASCSSNSEQVSVVKKELAARYSENEMEDFKFDTNDLSDRQAHETINKMYYADMKRFGTSESVLNLIESNLKEMGKTKGEVNYYKVDYSSVHGTDTLSKGVFLIDNENKVIFRRLLK